MSWLIIPDIHEQHERLARILAEHGHRGRPVFLGDVFDSFVPGQTEAMLSYLDAVLLDLDALWILGNHDAHYLYRARSLRCSGFTGGKRSKIHNVEGLVRRWQDKVKLFHVLDGWTVSHAGFHPLVLRDPLVAGDPLEMAAEMALRVADTIGGHHVLLEAGHRRGGFHPVGGPLWLDWTDFEPVEGMRQIVGHTTYPEPRWKGRNLCLDTNLGHIAVVDRDEVEIVPID